MARNPEIPNVLDECIDIVEFAKRYRISRARVFDLFQEGLPSMRLGRKRLIHAPTADKWLRDKLAGATPREVAS